jgi:four helix bundle protein
MARTFEELEVWQDARALTTQIYSLRKKNGFSKDFGLANQIQRAAVSVMSNIAEGFTRGGNKEFVQFLFVAKGSLAEVNSQLYVAMDMNYINHEEFDATNEKIKRLIKRVSALIKSIDPNKKLLALNNNNPNS